MVSITDFRTLLQVYFLKYKFLEVRILLTAAAPLYLEWSWIHSKGMVPVLCLMLSSVGGGDCAQVYSFIPDAHLCI